MQLESGQHHAASQARLGGSSSGYDKIALMTISAIAGNTGAVIPLNVGNRASCRS